LKSHCIFFMTYKDGLKKYLFIMYEMQKCIKR